MLNKFTIDRTCNLYTCANTTLQFLHALLIGIDVDKNIDL